MAVSDQIERIKTNIANAYATAETMGATMPETQNSENLSTTISTIAGGGDISDYFYTDFTASGTTSNSRIYIGNWCNGKLVNKIVADGLTFDSNAGYYFNGFLGDSLSLKNVDTSNTTNMLGMFYECDNLLELDLSSFDTHNVTNMASMFYNDSQLKSVDMSNFYTYNVTSMSSMFYNCRSLTNLDFGSFDTSKVTSMSNMFNHCVNLTDLDISFFDASKVTNVNQMFYGEPGSTGTFKMENLWFMRDLGAGYTQQTEHYAQYTLDFSRMIYLSKESLIDIIEKLFDLNVPYVINGGGTLYRQSLILGSANLAKLTEEEIAIATNKGWDVT